jgi:hypothetical protein
MVRCCFLLEGEASREQVLLPIDSCFYLRAGVASHGQVFQNMFLSVGMYSFLVCTDDIILQVPDSNESPIDENT